MNILNSWLSEARGRAVWLAAKLDIGQSALSQMRNGRRAIPLDRMEEFARHTKAFTAADLLQEAFKAKSKLRKAKARAAKQAAV